MTFFTVFKMCRHCVNAVVVVMAEVLNLPYLFILVFLEVSYMHISDLLNEVIQTPNHHRQPRRIPVQSSIGLKSFKALNRWVQNSITSRHELNDSTGTLINLLQISRCNVKISLLCSKCRHFDYSCTNSLEIVQN